MSERHFTDSSPAVSPIYEQPERASFPGLTTDIRAALRSVQTGRASADAVSQQMLQPFDVYSPAVEAPESQIKTNPGIGSSVKTNDSPPPRGLMSCLDLCNSVSQALAQTNLKTLLSSNCTMDLRFSTDSKGVPQEMVVVRDEIGNSRIAYSRSGMLSQYVKDPAGKVVMTFPPEKIV